MAISDRYRQIEAPSARLNVNKRAVVNIEPSVDVNSLPPLTGPVKMVGVRMLEDEIAAIDAARGKVSRQDFLRKAALWLADQADKLG